jgi:hypothetical protein
VSTGQLRADIRRLRERARPAMPVRSEAERFSYWQARARIRRNELTPQDVKHTRSMIALFRIQASLAGESAERLLERIAAYPHAPGTLAGEAEAEGRSLALIESELWRAVYHGEEGLEHMAGEMPDAWRDALAAADRWRDRLTGMPIEALAPWVIANRALMQREATGEEMVALFAEHLAPHGITKALMERVMGPDVVELSPEERGWLIYAPVADTLSSEWAWQVVEHIRKLKQAMQIEGGK